MVQKIYVTYNDVSWLFALPLSFVVTAPRGAGSGASAAEDKRRAEFAGFCWSTTAMPTHEAGQMNIGLDRPRLLRSSSIRIPSVDLSAC